MAAKESRKEAIDAPEWHGGNLDSWCSSFGNINIKKKWWRRRKKINGAYEREEEEKQMEKREEIKSIRKENKRTK